MRRNSMKTLTALAVSLAVAAVFTGGASAQVRDHAASQPGPSASKWQPNPTTEIPYLSHGHGVAAGTFVGDDALLRAGLVSPSGMPDLLQSDVPGGVTPPDLARAYEPRYEGVAQPDGHQPQLRGDEPLVIRDAPDGLVPNTPPSEVVSVKADSGGFDPDYVAISVGLGMVLATACAIALAAASGRPRVSHS